MDDPELELDLEDDELDESLPADLLAVGSTPPAGDAGEPDPTMLLPDDFLGQDDPEPALTFDDVGPVATPESAPDGQHDAVNDGWVPGLPDPVFKDAASEDPAPPDPMLSLPEGFFDSIGTDTPELDPVPPADDEVQPDAVPPAPAAVSPAPIEPGRDVAFTADPPPAALSPVPGGRADTRAKLRVPGFQHGVGNRSHGRMAAAGVAAAVVLGIVVATQPDPDRPRRLETAQRRPAVSTTVAKPASSPLAPLIPAAVEQPGVVESDPVAPGTGPRATAASGSAALRPAGPTGSGPASSFGSPRAGAAPRTASAAGPGGGAPAASNPAAGPAPARNPAAEPAPPPPDPNPRDRRSDTTATETTPATEPRPPATAPPPTEPVWDEPDPDPQPPPMPPPPTRPPTTDPPAPPPTSPPTITVPPTPPTSTPLPTRPCLDGDPPRPVPC